MIRSGTNVRLKHNAIVMELEQEFALKGQFIDIGCPLSPITCMIPPPKVIPGAEWKFNRDINMYSSDGVLMTTPDELAERLEKECGCELLGFGQEDMALAIKAHGHTKFDKAASPCSIPLFDIEGRMHMTLVKLRPKGEKGLKFLLAIIQKQKERDGKKK